MYLTRKIDNVLDDWLKSGNKTPMLVTGIRQCGKTESIKEFARRNNKQLLEINFWTNPEFCQDFEGKLDINTIISNISLRFPTKIISPDNTIIFLDEIQDCPRARLSFKNFAQDGRYKVIGSGSFLGINGYVKGDTTPVPTGFEEVFEMKTLDFEEFLWANGYDKEHIKQLKKYFDNRQEIPSNIHETYKKLFNTFICIGGFPNVVKTFLKENNIMEAFRVLKSIYFDMKSDFGRRKNNKGEQYFKASEVARIQNTFELIPTFLAKENKRFVTSKIQSGSSQEKVDAIEYLNQAHIVYKVHNVEIPSLPLKGYKINSQFKLFPTDIGIANAMYGEETLAAINNGDLSQGKGAIYESVVFDSLYKAGFDCFYFAKETGLEIDFVITYNSSAYLVEVKARNGNAKSAKTVMSHKEHYGPTKLLKIGDYNIGENENILTIPHYLVFMLNKK